jgi:thiosulfate reductase cytochrome b subunit
VNTVRARAAYVVTMSMVALLALAAPAAALTGSPVLADDQFKWFYWIGFVLALSLVLWLLATLVGYYFRVIRPKHRGREVS